MLKMILTLREVTKKTALYLSAESSLKDRVNCLFKLRVSMNSLGAVSQRYIIPLVYKNKGPERPVSVYSRAI
jgi:hypothetical protein